MHPSQIMNFCIGTIWCPDLLVKKSSENNHERIWIVRKSLVELISKVGRCACGENEYFKSQNIEAKFICKSEVASAWTECRDDRDILLTTADHQLNTWSVPVIWSSGAGNLVSTRFREREEGWARFYFLRSFIFIRILADRLYTKFNDDFCLIRFEILKTNTLILLVSFSICYEKSIWPIFYASMFVNSHTCWYSIMVIGLSHNKILQLAF